ncbi:MAG TPA: energy transducer TonB [Gammaproteobacteria bacterium]|nr:energy transducer TonB [Gammaproteobacteria bacterium]
MTTLRFPIAGVWGAVCAVALFALLAHLVNVPMHVQQTVERRIVDFTKLRVDTPVEPKPPPKVVRTPPQVPGTPRIGMPKEALDQATTFVRPAIAVRETGSSIRAMGTDRDVQPIVRVTPDYPQPLAYRGVEGWVKVQFTVTATGAVKDAFVVDASPSSVFDAAALKAIARWRYNPRVENGTAVERVGMQTVVRFTLENTF